MTILLATVGALLLVPAGQAFANGTMTIDIQGIEGGSGSVSSVGGYTGEGLWEGSPPIECSGPPASGTCSTELVEEEEEPGFEAIAFEGIVADPGSKLVAIEIEEGFDIAGTCGNFEESGACLIGQETGGGNAKATVYFECETEGGCEPEVKGPPLTLKVEEGSGTVVSNPSGLECSKAAPESCTTEAIEAGPVTLTASPAPGYLFKSWKGCDTANGRQCTIALAEPGRTVGAKFVKVWSLDASKSGGLGIMGTAPGGVNCGYACNSSSALYKEGSLAIKAKPGKHFHFVEFDNGTGSASSCNGVTAETCTITISSDSSIEELYAEDAKNTLTLAKEGGGQGFVKTKPTNINCGFTCTAAEAEFYANETPEVTVTFNKGTTSVTWVKGAGTCTGSATTCSVPMSASHELVAKFN